MNWSEKERKKEKKNFFFPWWVGGVLFWINNNNNNKQFHYIQHVFKITRIHYIYIYIQSTTKDKKDINKIKKE